LNGRCGASESRCRPRGDAHDGELDQYEGAEAAQRRRSITDDALDHRPAHDRADHAEHEQRPDLDEREDAVGAGERGQFPDPESRIHVAGDGDHDEADQRDRRVAR